MSVFQFRFLKGERAPCPVFLSAKSTRRLSLRRPHMNRRSRGWTPSVFSKVARASRVPSSLLARRWRVMVRNTGIRLTTLRRLMTLTESG